MRKGSLLFLIFLAGCTERWIQVRSEPPGATVYVDGENIGVTPCKTRFVWYGQREVVLERDGYESHVEIVRLRAPWWQWPIIDLFPDFFLPWTFRDRHAFFFSLKKLTFDPAERAAVKERAKELKKRLEEDR